MRAIRKFLPVSSANNLDIELPGSFFHGCCDLVVQGPVPSYLITNPSTQIDSVARDVPTVQRLTGPGFYQCLLTLWCP